MYEYTLVLVIVNQSLIYITLSGECPNVTVRYKQKRTFFNPKFDQICPKIATFPPFSDPKLLGIRQLIQEMSE